MTATANTMNACVTETELRDLLQAGPTIEQFEAVIPRLPCDLRQFSDRLADLHGNTEAEARQAIQKALQACARPGCTIGDTFAALIDQTLTDHAAARTGTYAEERAFLLEDLREAVAAEDEAGLAVALGMAPFSSSTYAASLRTLADAMNPDELADPERVQAARVRALRGAATELLDDELIGAILTALDAWAVLHAETPHQKAVREAFKEAGTLMDTLGEDDPRTLDAVIKAVNLKEPGCCSRMLAECGIQMPKPDRCTDDGEPLYSLEAIAAALDADPDDLEEHARELEALGIGGVVRVAGDSTHTLQ